MLKGIRRAPCFKAALTKKIVEQAIKLLRERPPLPLQQQQVGDLGLRDQRVWHRSASHQPRPPPALRRHGRNELPSEAIATTTGSPAHFRGEIIVRFLHFLRVAAQPIRSLCEKMLGEHVAGCQLATLDGATLDGATLDGDRVGGSAPLRSSKPR